VFHVCLPQLASITLRAAARLDGRLPEGSLEAKHSRAGAVYLGGLAIDERSVLQMNGMTDIDPDMAASQPAYPQPPG